MPDWLACGSDSSPCSMPAFYAYFAAKRATPRPWNPTSLTLLLVNRKFFLKFSLMYRARIRMCRARTRMCRPRIRMYRARIRMYRARTRMCRARTRMCRARIRVYRARIHMCRVEPCSPPRSLARPAAARAAGCGAVRCGAGAVLVRTGCGSKHETAETRGNYFTVLWVEGEKNSDQSNWTGSENLQDINWNKRGNKQSYWANIIVLQFATNGEP